MYVQTRWRLCVLIDELTVDFIDKYMCKPDACYVQLVRIAALPMRFLFVLCQVLPHCEVDLSRVYGQNKSIIGG